MQKINFQLNGERKQAFIDPHKSLLKMLREDFGLTGAKEGCGQGHCGTCAVLFNGKAVLSCRYPAAKANGAEIITIEGLGTPEKPHPIQLAFVQAGAIQCGFCTPGMIIRTKALLDQNLNPSREEIVHALRPHLCRCTGYTKIFAAVELAARLLKGESEGLAVFGPQNGAVVGRRIPRQDALAKATGTELYAADLRLEDLLHLKVLRSPHAHARIIAIDGEAAKAMPGVAAVFTAADVPGTNRLKISRADQPVLCDDVVRCAGDPVAAVAAVTEAAAEAALARIAVTYEPLPAVFDPREALAEEAPQIHADHPNLLSRQAILRGDAPAGFEQAEVIIEHKYFTPLVEHAYLEPDAGIAYLDGEGRLVIHAGSQNIHHDRQSLAAALGLNPEMVRIVQSPTGGAFGGKLDISVQGVLGLAALKLKKPVKLVYTREEVFRCTTKRHPMAIRCRLGANRNGELLALEMEIISATGAYASFGKSVLTRALIHAAGPYRIPHVRLNGRVVYTNGPVAGAMRGFGVPQVIFALESQLDLLAVELGIDPWELRYRNCLRRGDATATGQVLGHEIGIRPCLEKINEYYRPALLAAREFNSRQTVVKRGAGLAAMWFGTGKSKPDEANAEAVLQPDGTVQIFIGAADLGQGSDLVFAQIAAQELEMPLASVRVISTDTGITPDGGYSSGSRQTYMSGGAVLAAAAALKKALLREAGTLLQEDPAALEWTAGVICSRQDRSKRVTLGELARTAVAGQRFPGKKTAQISALDPETGAGVPFETYAFGVQLAEVEVNIQSGEVKVLRVVAVHDSGTPVNPLTMEGQIEGGIVMGLGYALLEEYVSGETTGFGRYRLPRTKDVPEIVPVLLAVPRPGGPFGAAGVGECALVPTAPAILNAIHNACGVRIYDLPATKEKIKKALQ